MAPRRQRDEATAIAATLQSLPSLQKKLLSYSLPDLKIPSFWMLGRQFGLRLLASAY